MLLAVPSPALFELATAKAKVSKIVEDTAPGQFKHFYASPLFDRMVTSCLVYFIDNLQLTTLGQVQTPLYTTQLTASHSPQSLHILVFAVAYCTGCMMKHQYALCMFALHISCCCQHLLHGPSAMSAGVLILHTMHIVY